MRGPKFVELDGRPLVRIEAVAKDGVGLLDEHHQCAYAEDAVEHLKAAPESALVCNLALDTIEVAP